MKIVFMGTPDFALFSLKALVESGKHKVLAVVTQPDKPGNRGVVTFSPVKKYALAHGISVYQFVKIGREGGDVLRDIGADIFITAAYGQIISREILQIPKYGVVNVHASLLPAYRGSSPIQWALIRGEKETGITIMQTDAGLDTGDILLQKALPIADGDDAGSLFVKLGALGAETLLEFLTALERGSIRPLKQDETRASYFPMLKKADGRINWHQSAPEIGAWIRGVTPWPGAFFIRGGKTVKVHSARVLSEIGGSPGEVLRADKNELVVACGSGAVSLTELQTEGKRRLPFADFLNGNKITVGEKFE